MNNSFLFQEDLSIAQRDIQVTIAVFASKAVSGRVWFLRIVVMKHDPDDTTFKVMPLSNICGLFFSMTIKGQMSQNFYLFPSAIYSDEMLKTNM